MAKTKIDWCDYVLNPVWGCTNGCDFCYARKIANRFGKKLFGERYHGFDKPFLTGASFDSLPKKPCCVFLDSMSDFCCWKQDWHEMVIENIKRYPQHRFILLTKKPGQWGYTETDIPNINNVLPWQYPTNCYIGTSVTNFENAMRARVLKSRAHFEDLRYGIKRITIVSLEPLLDDSVHSDVYTCQWLIVGLETGRKNIFKPKYETMLEIVHTCQDKGLPLFMKESCKQVWPDDLIQQYPEEL